MRVAFVTYAFGWGGSERHLEQLVMLIDPALFDSTIVCFGPNVYEKSLNARFGVQVPIVAADGTKGLLGYWRALRRARPDVVVFVNGKLGLFPWSAYVAARLSGARRVIGIEHLEGEPAPPTVRGSGPGAWARKLVGWRTRYMWRMRAGGVAAHRTLCVSGAVRKRVLEDYGYPPNKTVRLVNGIDIAHFTPAAGAREKRRRALGFSPDDKVLICVARLGALKRIDILLETMVLLRDMGVAYTCLVVGDGPMRAELEALAVSLRVNDRVRFVGHTDDVREYLLAGDLYVSTSEREGFGLAVAEAIAMGLVCVVTNIGGHDEMIIDGETGVMVPVGDARATAEAIARLLRDDAARHRLRDAARRRVETEFSIDTMIRRYEAEFAASA